MKIVCIAGGSGSGKSTVSYALVDSRPELFEVINFDDYQKLSSEPSLPMIDGMINWDHPDIILWDFLIKDIKRLKSGKTVTIDTWAHRSNTAYPTSASRISRTIYPKPIIIIEGNMALYSPELNLLYDRSYYLDLDASARYRRRNKDRIIGEENYIGQVLEPMHQKFVEPTKAYADEIIIVSSVTTIKLRDHLLHQLI